MNIMDSINKVLNDPESMKQLNELAKMFSDSNSATEANPPVKQDPPDSSRSLDLSGLIKAFSSQNKPPSNDQAGCFDMNKLLVLQSVMEKANTKDKNIDLLLALKPHLNEENRNKVDRLIKIFRLMSLYPVLKESGLVGGDLLGII